MHGWICPKCQRGNAPHVSQCPCAPVVAYPGVPVPPAIVPTTVPNYPIWKGPIVTCVSGSASQKAQDGIVSWN